MDTSGNTNKVYWQMKNGEMIDVMDMDLNHLRNTLKMILRNREKALQQVQSRPKVEFKLNGDMANEFHHSFMSDEDDERFEEGQTYNL